VLGLVWSALGLISPEQFSMRESAEYSTKCFPLIIFIKHQMLIFSAALNLDLASAHQ
jgi:hypothetical protein